MCFLFPTRIKEKEALNSQIRFNPFDLKKDITYVFGLSILIALFRFPLEFAYNELDVLPYSYAVYNSDWLPADWYLSNKIEYRFLFSYLLGGLIEGLGFIKATFAGRFISYLFFSASFIALVRALNWKLFPAIVGFLSFLLLGQSLSFGEWMVGGLETKVFAYSSILFSIAFLLRKKLTIGLFFAGLALSFHLLIGAYHLILSAPIILFWNQKISDSASSILKSLWAYLIGGSIGLYGISKYLFSGSSPDSKSAWEIYVQFRVPHHALPNEETNLIWFIVLGLGLLILFIIHKDQQTKKLSLYALMSLIPFIIGMVIFQFDRLSEMRYYWFRMADVLLPFISLLLLFQLISEVLPKWRWRIKKQLSYIGLSIIIIAGIVFHQQIRSSKFVDELWTFSWDEALHSKDYDPELSQWIKENTLKEDVFIIPTHWESFYVCAERSIFAAYKHAPQKAEDILEWHARLTLLNGGNKIEKQGFNACGEINSHLHKMPEAELLQLKERGADLIILHNNYPKNLPLLYRNDQYSLYSLKTAQE